ncbi:isochorismate synthase [Rossellomorea aquimaris]|uniref:isochorismate synthase n=1 Tax=Rossellomorea aquimaris TaxID=189382 RepID=UPI001CD42121|nr:isochorismate synthase [Rossellomorea aquimaris]MCA1056791.1 isochorismate synthase [Rossellomorea aquimaris]
MVTIHKTNIENAYDTAREKAKQYQHPVLFSIVEKIDSIDPLSFYNEGHSLFKGARFLWKDRDHTITIAGLGSALMISTEDERDQFFAVENEWKRFIEEAVILSTDRWAGTGPLMFGGFRFDPLNQKGGEWDDFENGTLQIPSFMLTKSKESDYLTVNVLCGPEDEDSLNELLQFKDELLRKAKYPSTPDEATVNGVEDYNPAEWKDSVQNVVDTLKAGEMEKVVLARKCKVTFDSSVTSDFVLDNLWKQQPDSFIFSFEQDSSCFIGATPERLVKKTGEEVLSTCLAGSIARGSSLDEDERLGEELLNDEKNRYEHHLVVENIRQALNPYCEELTMPEKPGLMKMKDIQHLYTPVVGRASLHTSLLEMVEKLHPTPALGGVPREKALHVIRQEEKMDRGLYAGPVGWMDAYGNGEFAVAIRSGLLQGSESTLFAGCGIVADSDPESEFRETQMKFRPMLRALGGNING